MIEAGIKATQPCRLEYVDKTQYAHLISGHGPEHVILDVGHNPPALERSLLALKIRHPHTKIRIIYGTSAKKDVYSSLMNIIQYASHIHLVQAQHARAMPLENLNEATNQVKAEITQESGKIFEPIQESGNIPKTIKFAFEKCAQGRQKEMIVIAGSFYIMQEARQYLGIKDEYDPLELNEIIAPEDRGKENIQTSAR